MKKTFGIILSAVFWLILWQLLAVRLNSRILLVSPVEVIKRLFVLIITADFWKSIAFSLSRIMAGFLLGVFFGTAVAVLSGKFRIVRTLFSPLISVMKSIPVASITILAIIWTGSKNLSVFVTVLICVPIVYSNILEGIDSLDHKLNEMAHIFRIPVWRRFVGVYLSQLLPYFRAALRLAVGLSWKSGAAAEVIGIPSGSIGEKLFESKVYLETADLFAWTLVIVLLSFLCEKIIMLLISMLQKRVQRM